MARSVASLPHALADDAEPVPPLAAQLEGKRPAVFLDYDGTLTPIVDRPEDAVISPQMRDAVRDLAARCPVCVVSGRDRQVVQQLMGLDHLTVAGSHGFDIASPAEGEIHHPGAGGSPQLLEDVRARLADRLAPVQGALLEPKAASVAVHYRLASPADAQRVAEVVDSVLTAYPDELKVTPGKMVYEIQPKIDWDKGKAVLFLLRTLGLDSEDVVGVYLGDDITDEDAFGALRRTSPPGIGVLVGDACDPETGARDTAASYILNTIGEVARFLDGLAR